MSSIVQLFRQLRNAVLWFAAEVLSKGTQNAVDGLLTKDPGGARTTVLYFHKSSWNVIVIGSFHVSHCDRHVK